MRRALAIVLIGSTVVGSGALTHRARAFVPPPANHYERRGDMVLVPAATYRFAVEAKWTAPSPSGPLPGQSYLTDPNGYEVTVGAFFIDRTEVTVAAYTECVGSGACPALVEGDNYSNNHTPICTYGKAGFEQHPVNCVTHDEAQAYCASVGKRLPTEYEFELAERGTNGRAFPWGNDAPTVQHVNACDAACAREGLAKLGESFTTMYANDPTADDGWGFTAPVATYPLGASPYGALDMSGNVEEWVEDGWWDYGNPGGPPTGPSADYVVRGGSWDLNNYESFAATRRTSASEHTRAAWLGFRCARSA